VRDQWRTKAENVAKECTELRGELDQKNSALAKAYEAAQAAVLIEDSKKADIEAKLAEKDQEIDRLMKHIESIIDVHLGEVKELKRLSEISERERVAEKQVLVEMNTDLQRRLRETERQRDEYITN
jgi:hypothetical protein